MIRIEMAFGHPSSQHETPKIIEKEPLYSSLILVPNQVPFLQESGVTFTVDAEKYEEALSLANDEFTTRYAKNPTEAIPLWDEFDDNGQRITIVKLNDQGDIVASISIVCAMDKSQKLDVEKYFTLPKENTRKVPRFSIGRLMLNHRLMIGDTFGHEFTTKLYQQLHDEASELIEQLARNKEHHVFAVVNNKTHAFIERSHVSSKTLNTTLIDNDNTKSLRENFPKYWNNSPRLVELTKGVSILETFKQRLNLMKLFARESDRGQDIVRHTAYADPDTGSDEVIAQSLINKTMDKLSSSVDKDNVSLHIEELKKFPVAILENMMVFIGGTEVSIQQWINAAESGEKDYGYAIVLEEGLLYKHVPREIDEFLRIAGNLMSHGDPDTFIRLANLHLQFMRSRKTISVGGLSVGGEALLETVHQLPWGTARIADPKKWHSLNQNRANFPQRHLNENKAILRTEQIVELRPWTRVEAFTQGITEENVEQFVKNSFVVVDAMDNILMKIRLREEARKQGVPTVMVSDVGSVVQEVRRFDLEPNISLFASVSDDELYQLRDEYVKEKNLPAFIKLVHAMVGAENISDDFKQELESFSTGKIGLIPQPHKTVQQAANVVADCISQLAQESLGEAEHRLESGILLHPVKHNGLTSPLLKSA